MKFKFGTKAETLENLKKYLKIAYLPDQMYFTLHDWNKNSKSIIEKILSKYPNKLIAVRSSGLNEDIVSQSLAGVYESEINVSSNFLKIKKAIEKVANSYGTYNRLNQILVQPMIENVDISGVIFSYDLSTGAPYITINYDDFSGRTDTVTSGADSKCIYIDRSGKNSLISERFKKLLAILYQIESIINLKKLDIEFCIDRENRIFVLQVRRLVSDEINNLQKKKHSAYVKKINSQVMELSKAKSKCYGSSFLLGEMPDWNPAEIIGTNPNLLASSLYQYLITNKVWSSSRHMMGYKNIRHPLLIMIGNHPYVDVKLSLNSFLPKGLKANIAKKIIDEQIDFLIKNPHLHDKLEFEVATTSWDFDLSKRLKRLSSAGLTKNEITTFENTIKKHTIEIIKNKNLEIKTLINKVNKLERKIKDISCDNSLNAIFQTLDSTIKYGTIPFSILARQAFISVAILRSLVKNNYISQLDYDNFMGSINNVTTKFVNDMYLVSKNKISKEKFLIQYGHLRPGTYDINVLRYDENAEYYLSGKNLKPFKHSNFSLSRTKKNRLDIILKKSKMFNNSNDLFNYAYQSISGREYAKFEFTKGISSSLKSIATFFNNKKIKKEDVAFLDIFKIKDMNPNFNQKSIKKLSLKNKEENNVSRHIKLPSLISSYHDTNIIRVPFAKPSFITNKKVSGKHIFLKKISSKIDLRKKIVVIESADPGYDWIFSHEISGLITKYGGANSHMAIRCAEFGIAAAIGCGERLFLSIINSQTVEIDCTSEMIRII